MNDQVERPVYMDHAATTFMKPEVLAAMAPPYFSEHFGNPPSSLYRFAGEPRNGVEAARGGRLRAAIGAGPEEIFFTAGGGTEADNWAIKGGVALANRARGNHIVTSAIEHHAVLHTCEWLEKQGGFSVTYLPPVDGSGGSTRRRSKRRSPIGRSSSR